MIVQPHIDQTSYLSPEEFLDWEASQDLKYEYKNGKIIAITGGTIRH
ncbi:hypothetical protein [Pseudanabaena mucicola]|uniref:Uma2 family endonuclease n=1 Tax=Pseudanabaena mucicola FACHB-723 TaxID=2692860 RepID=A0ABR7ZTE2_9CYAN|nr:hypothetical protein [Pseudanabaena mucicola]MBD2187206.1 hypothetical protein [Pseudanabaena mucicola FACHB-723]